MTGLLQRSGLRRAGFALLASLCYAGFQWTVVAAIARLAGVHTVGEYSLALAIAAPVFMALNMRLRFIHGSDVEPRFGFKSYLMVRAATGCLAVLIVAGIAGGGPFTGAIASLLVVIACVKWLEGVEDTAFAELQRAQRLDVVALSAFLTGLLVSTAFVIAMIWSQSLIIGCIAIALARIAMLLIAELPWAYRSQLRVNRERGTEGVVRHSSASPRSANLTVVGLAVTTSPLAIAALMDSLNAVIPRYMLQWESGAKSVGMYTLLTYFAMAGFLATGAFAQSRTAQIGSAVASSDTARFFGEARRLLIAALLVGSGGMIVLAAFGIPIFSLLYGDELRVSRCDLLLVMLAGTCSYLSLAVIYLLSALRVRWYQVAVYAANMATLLAVGAPLTATYDVTGALSAVAIANAVQTMLSFVVIRRVARRALIAGGAT